MRLALLLLFVSSAAVSAQGGDPARQARAEGRFIRGLTSQYVQNDTAAVRSIAEALSLQPDSPAIQSALAESYLALNQNADALFLTSQTVEGGEQIARFLATHAAALTAAGQVNDARAALERASHLAPTDPEIALALAQAYQAQGRAEDARAVLERVLALGPDPDVQAAMDRVGSPGSAGQRGGATGTPSVSPGFAAFEAGDFVSAADELARLVDADPRQLDAWRALLTSLARTADPRAARYADDAVLLFPTVPSILAPAAEAFLAAGRKPDARAAADAGLRALTASGDDAALRTRLEQARAAANR